MDSILLFPPGASSIGSAIQLGSWLMADPGPDFGAHGLIESIAAQNAMRDGGAFAFRHAPIRKMAFPLVVNTPSVVNWEAQMARWSTPGAFIAVQPEGIPSSQAVYFDVIDGRWEPDYNLFENRAHVRKGILHLDTQPWGYWPTEILLASAASIGYLGQLPVNGASVIGDVPPLARLQIIPTAASTFMGFNTGIGFTPVDMIAVGFGARPSFAPFIPPAAFIANALNFTASSGGIMTPTLIGDAFAPASQAIVWGGTASFTPTAFTGASGLGWKLIVHSASLIPSGLEPAYRGRFRAFAFLKMAPGSMASFWNFQTLLDAERVITPSVTVVALATGNQVATAGQQFLPALGGVCLPSNGYMTLDMGELTLPAGGGSGIQQSQRMRFWLSAAAAGTGSYFTGTIMFGGVYLLPVDGAAGVLPRGGFAPSFGGNGTQAGFDWNTNFVEQMLLTTPAPALLAVGAQPQVLGDARAYYRGVAPRIGASTTQLVFLTGDRALAGAGGAVQQVFQGNVEYSQVSVSYRPTFQFLYGV